VPLREQLTLEVEPVVARQWLELQHQMHRLLLEGRRHGPQPLSGLRIPLGPRVACSRNASPTKRAQAQRIPWPSPTAR